MKKREENILVKLLLYHIKNQHREARINEATKMLAGSARIIGGEVISSIASKYQAAYRRAFSKGLYGGRVCPVSWRSAERQNEVKYQAESKRSSVMCISKYYCCRHRSGAKGIEI